MSEPTRTDDPDSRTLGLVGRRGFAQVSAMGLALPALDWLGVRGEGKPRPPVPLSVGFLRGSDEAPGFLPWTRTTDRSESREHAVVVPARSVAGGVEALGRLRLTVHGLYPAMPSGSRLLSTWLDLVVPAPDMPGEDLRFAAWSYSSHPVPAASPGTSFVLPDTDDGVSLLVETLERPLFRGMPVTDGPVPWNGKSGPAGLRQRFLARFHRAGSEGRLPLRRGVYLLALKAGTWSWAERLPGLEESPRPDLLSVVVSVRPDSKA